MSANLPPLPKLTSMRDQGPGMQSLLRVMFDIQRRLGGVGIIDPIQEAANAAALAQVGVAVAISQAATANATANSAGSGLPSGSDINKFFSVSSNTFTAIAAVALNGITAGTLRFDTTSIYERTNSSVSTAAPFQGSYRITERLSSGGASNVLFTGTWTATRETDPPSIVDVIVNNQIALDAARPAVGIIGGVTYTLEVARASGLNTVTNLGADFRAAKAS